jgi:nicotinate-nucleotide pyrophosphorylase (carboxylating)
LREDVGRGDVTTRALVPSGVRAQGTIYARQTAVVCGLEIARAVFRALDPSARVRLPVRDGARVRDGVPVLRVRASARAVLTGERVALNFLQRLSGIATLTAEFVRRVRGTRAHIMDTRKTTPSLRAFEKYAVRCGGGRNHRQGLDDAVLVKDNHLTPAREGLRRRLAGLKARGYRIEIESQSFRRLREHLELPVDVIMLDNFNPPMLRRAVPLVRKLRPKVEIEASGGVSLETARAIALTGVDRISVGALTHSALAADFSLDLR